MWGLCGCLLVLYPHMTMEHELILLFTSLTVVAMWRHRDNYELMVWYRTLKNIGIECNLVFYKCYLARFLHSNWIYRLGLTLLVVGGRMKQKNMRYFHLGGTWRFISGLILHPIKDSGKRSISHGFLMWRKRFMAQFYNPQPSVEENLLRPVSNCKITGFIISRGTSWKPPCSAF